MDESVRHARNFYQPNAKIFKSATKLFPYRVIHTDFRWLKHMYSEHALGLFNHLSPRLQSLWLWNIVPKFTISRWVKVAVIECLLIKVYCSATIQQTLGLVKSFIIHFGKLTAHITICVCVCVVNFLSRNLFINKIDLS